MAVRPHVPILLAGLLLLLLLPAVAAGHGPADQGRAAATAGYHAGAVADAGPPGPAAAPEVTRAAERPGGAQRQALGTGTRGGGRESAPGPRDGRGGPHRGPPSADPEPYAVPAQPAGDERGAQGGAGRARKDGTALPAPYADGAEVPDPRLLLQLLLVLGFRRVRPGNVLEHPARREICGAIRAEPGLDLAGCAAATGANRETLRYHLALLVCCGKVVEETRSGSVRYFPHDPALTPVRRALVHALHNASLAPMLLAIRDAPGVARHELADRLGMAGPSVTRQVQRLIGEGLVESERRGRSTCYRLTDECRAALEPGPGAGAGGVPLGRATA